MHGRFTLDNGYGQLIDPHSRKSISKIGVSAIAFQYNHYWETVTLFAIILFIDRTIHKSTHTSGAPPKIYMQ